MQSSIIKIGSNLNLAQQDALVCRKDLGEEKFLEISSVTPIVNVDLLIQNSLGETLLVWRNDKFHTGWHFIGGVLRNNESLSSRIKKVASDELNVDLQIVTGPIELNEMIFPQNNYRNHFLSFLYNCKVKSNFNMNLKYLESGTPNHGEWKWFKHAPKDLIPEQSSYRKYFKKGGDES